MLLESRWSKQILAVLAAGVCAMMFYFVICERDLRQTGSSSQELYSKRVVGLSLQGDLQYATQESRRTFLYVLTDDELENFTQADSSTTGWEFAWTAPATASKR